VISARDLGFHRVDLERIRVNGLETLR
jgi:hypothetical protein